MPKAGQSSAAPGEKSEREKMLSGEPYLPSDPQLWQDRVRARRLLKRFNHDLAYDDTTQRELLLAELLGGLDPAAPPFIEPPFFCDYGYNIHLGSDFYCNFNCTFLDCGPVHIGDRVLFGPGVQVYAVTHPVDPGERAAHTESCRPVRIGSDCWVGGNATILQGVTIGAGVTVAAGSVVTKDVEPYCVVAGNPAKVIRRLVRPSQE